MDINTVYGAFLDYYGNVDMKRIRQDNGWSVYAMRFSTQLSTYRYLFAIAMTAPLEPEIMKLNDINWMSLQTRESDEFHTVPEIIHLLDERKKQALPDVLVATQETVDRKEYNCPLPVRVELVSDKSRAYQYPDKLLLYQAMESYNAVVTLL